MPGFSIEKILPKRKKILKKEGKVEENEDKPELHEIKADSDKEVNLEDSSNTPDTENTDKLTFTAAVVDTTDILRAKAYRAASEKMTADKKGLSGFKGLLRKVWKYNYAEQYLHEKERVGIKKQMLETGNLYVAEKLSVEEQESAQQEFATAILSRFIPDIKEMVEDKLGERREEMEAGEKTTEIKKELKNIIDLYADGKLDEAGFEGAKRLVFEKIEKSNDQKTIKQGEMYVDNFLQIAQQVRDIKKNIRQAADHQEKLAAFDYDIKLVLGKAKEGIKTETHYNLAERTVENLRRTKLGSMVNETTLAAAVGLTYSAVSFISQRITRSKAVAIGTLGLAAGVFAVYTGIKENQMQKRERQTLETRDVVNQGVITVERKKVESDIAALEAAKNAGGNKNELKKIDKNLKQLQKQHEKLLLQEQFIYDKMDAASLTNGLEEVLYDVKPDGERTVKNFNTPEDLDKVLNQLADIEARLDISNERKIDLISYSSLSKVEAERQKLLVAKWEAKAKLAALPEHIKNDWEKRLENLTALHRSELLDDYSGIQGKDKYFNKYKNKAVLEKVSQGALVVLSIGATAQEGYALFSDDQEGLVENLVKGDQRVLGNRDTALESLRNWLSGHDEAGQLQTVAMPKGLVTLPENCQWLENQDGSFTLTRGSEVLAENLHVNPDGSLDELAQQKLAAEDIRFNSSQYIIDEGKTTTVEIKGTPTDIINRSSEDFTEVKRTLWYANDTPMHQGTDGKWYGADLNELKEQWGGDNGSGINTETNSYEMIAFKMQPDGSFQTVNGVRLSDNATKLIKEGKMKFLFSLSDDTQNKVIELPVDPKTGAISVPRDGQYGKLLFGEKDNHAFLKAKFAEVAVSAGLDKDGIENVHVFATAVGEGIEEADITELTEAQPLFGTKIMLDIPRDWEVPPVIPVGWRSPLERVKETGTEYGLYQKASIDKDRLKKMEKRRSETLKQDPTAELNHYNEAEQYFNKMDSEYIKEVKELAGQAGMMSEKNKLSICIPVAGHQEGDKIYESLKNYTYQEADNDDFELCLLVNRPDRDPSGKKVKWDRTLDEIERFKKDYPQMNIKVMKKVIPIEQINIGLIRKLLSDSVLYRHHNRGEKVSDLIMVSNDADNLGIDPRYVKNFINRFNENPKLDGILGQLDWDPEAYTKYPLVHIGTRIFQYYSARGRNIRGSVASSGANYAYKSSIYAAIGGYLEDVPGGEDVAIGQAISLARGDTYETQGYGGSASRLFTSARRAIDVLKKYNIAPIEQWEKGFSVFDDEVRKMNLNDLSGDDVDYNDPKYLEKFKGGLEYIINRTLNVFERGEKLGKGHEIYRHDILGRLGIDYNLNEHGDVVITDMSKLVKRLKTYKEEGVLRRDIRSGKESAVNKLKKIRKTRNANSK